MSVKEKIPSLARGCRLSTTEIGVLLVPEAIVQVGQTGAEILSLCDGKRTVSQIVEELTSKYAGAPADRITQETVDFLEKLAERGSIQFK